MGTILEFRRSEAAADRTERSVEGSLGEIIIFPGVRIERYRRVSADLPEKSDSTSPQRVQRARKK